MHKNVLFRFLRFSVAVAFHIAPVTEKTLTCGSLAAALLQWEKRLSWEGSGPFTKEPCLLRGMACRVLRESHSGAREAYGITVARLSGEGRVYVCVCVRVVFKALIKQKYIPINQIKGLSQFVSYVLFTNILEFHPLCSECPRHTNISEFEMFL